MTEREYDFSKFLAVLNVSLIGAVLLIDEKTIYFNQYEWLPQTIIALLSLSFVVAIYYSCRSLDTKGPSTTKYLKFAGLAPCGIVVATLLKLT